MGNSKTRHYPIANSRDPCYPSVDLRGSRVMRRLTHASKLINAFRLIGGGGASNTDPCGDRGSRDDRLDVPGMVGKALGYSDIEPTVTVLSVTGDIRYSRLTRQ
jgi:hypothetical protein